MFGIAAALLITRVVGLTSPECGLTLQPELSIVHLVEGNNFTIVCDASCFSPLTPDQMAWFDHYNNKISHSHRIQSVSYNRWMYIRLIILNASLHHTGRYTCTGVVNDRVVRTYININVIEESVLGYRDEDLPERRGDVRVPDMRLPRRRPRRDVGLHHLLRRNIRDADSGSGTMDEVAATTLTSPSTHTGHVPTTTPKTSTDSITGHSVKPASTTTTTPTTTTTTTTPTGRTARARSAIPRIRGPTTAFGKYGVLGLALAVSAGLLLLYILLVLNVCVPKCFKKQQSVNIKTEHANKDMEGTPGSVDLIALKPIQDEQQQNKPDSQGLTTIDLDDKDEGAGTNKSTTPSGEQSPSMFVSTFIIGRKPSTDRAEGVFVHEGIAADKEIPADKTGQEGEKGQEDKTGQEGEKGQADKTGQEGEEVHADKTGQEGEIVHADKTGQEVEKAQAEKTGQEGEIVHADKAGQEGENGDQTADDKENVQAYSKEDEKAAQAFLETHFEFHKTDAIQAEEVNKEVNKEIDKEVKKEIDQWPDSIDAIPKTLDSVDSSLEA